MELLDVVSWINRNVNCMPTLQMWALHALSMLVDLAGPLYHSHLEASFTLVLRLLLSTPHTHVEVQQSLGRCLNALITSMGPDLQGIQHNINTLAVYAHHDLARENLFSY